MAGIATITRGTTPQVTCNVLGADISAYDCYVSIGETGAPVLTVTDVTATYDGADTAVTFALTQQQTLQLAEGMTRIQLRAVDGAKAVASGEVAVKVLPIILDGEL